jgi:signal transduction histidine kinase/CheY-like chemotaxis protein
MRRDVAAAGEPVDASTHIGARESDRRPRWWPKRWRYYGVLLFFPVLSFIGFYLVLRPTSPAWPEHEPAEGFYWSAAQYQLALGKVREQLLALVVHDDPLTASDTNELRVRSDVLVSRGRLLSEPSEIQQRLQRLAEYDATVAALLRFETHLGLIMRREPFTVADVREALLLFPDAETAASRFANSARQRELDGRNDLYSSLIARENDRLFWGLMLWAVFNGWLFWILLSQNRDRARVTALNAALAGEKEAREQLREEMDTKAQFLSMVSHELRSPLQVVVSSVDLLGMEVPPSERSSAVARIRRASLMMGVQLRDLLTIARGEAGRLEMQPESFEATELVQDVGNVAAHAAHSRGLRFCIEVPDGPVFVRADVQRISQVLANLVSNAVKYAGEGEVSMTLRPPDMPSGRIQVVVADTGPGLPVDAMQRLKMPRSRIEEWKPRQDGSGLGLTIVRTVMDHLGGTLDVWTAAGEGTRFEVSIPVLFEDPDEVPSDSTADGLVLVVDDQADISDSVAALVKGYGHPCHVARTGEEALRLLGQHRYETCFLDLDLPQVGGVELAQRIRVMDGKSRRTHLVAITAYRRELEPEVFDEVLIKPVEGLRVKWNLAHRFGARAARR